MQYLGNRKIELLYLKIKSSTRINLKTRTSWLINEARLEKYLESKNRIGLAIVIIIGSSMQASKLCSKKLRFGKTLKVIENYLKVRSRLICMICIGIGHNCLR